MQKYLESFNSPKVKKIAKHYRRYRVVRFILLNPVFRFIALVLGALILIVTWPFIVLYLVIRAFRLGRWVVRRRQTSGSNQESS